MSARRYDNSAQIELNIRAHLERTFIDNGLYQNMASGQLRVGGSRADILTRKSPTQYESFFNNWVIETDASGVTTFPTVNVSGVVVDGVFNPRGGGTYEPAIDFDNGRVIFGVSIPTASTVEAVFSYKEVHFDYPDSFLSPALFSEFKDNVIGTNVTVPSGLITQLPVVVIDLQNRTDTPHQLGGGTQLSQQVVFHILANNRRQMNRIVDQLSTRSSRKVIQGVNFNDTPILFTPNGDRAATYRDFTDMQDDNALKWKKLYIDSTRVVSNNDVFYGFHRARVDWNLILFLPPGG
ncbi:hypothetical protein KAR91_50055 [Candidatus Pacearchaeota archaeon]|nr:hypothetical protein [Candidatus Pacearchaeota archaeon]